MQPCCPQWLRNIKPNKQLEKNSKVVPTEGEIRQNMKATFLSELKRKEAIESANELTEALVDHLNVG